MLALFRTRPLSYIAVFVADRFTETPGWAREADSARRSNRAGTLPAAEVASLGLAAATAGGLPVCGFASSLERPVARRSSKLAHTDTDSGRSTQTGSGRRWSRSIVRLATAASRTPVPNPRHRRWAGRPGVPLALTLIAARRHCRLLDQTRLASLAGSVERHRPLHLPLYNVPDENRRSDCRTVDLDVALSRRPSGSRKAVPRGTVARAGDVAARQRREYGFDLPPQEQADTLKISVGDARKKVAVTPNAA